MYTSGNMHTYVVLQAAASNGRFPGLVQGFTEVGGKLEEVVGAYNAAYVLGGRIR